MTRPEMVAHLLSTGGRLLLVGGSVSDLPRQYQENPQILVWDDNRQGLLQKEIPTNVKVIMWNRWISHSMADKLHGAAARLHAIKFPMLRTREIKELLSEIVQTDPPDVPTDVAKTEIELEVRAELDQRYTPERELRDPTGTVKKEREVTKRQSGKKGFLQEFIAKHMDLNVDYTVKGSIKKEGDRLFAIAEKENVKTTQASITNALGIVVKNLGKKSATKPTTRATASAAGQDDFEQLGVLIEDAIAAMKLVQEHLPKVRRETERLRGMREKVLKLFT